MKKVVVFTLLGVISISASAQVTGKVADASTKSPLSGATVKLNNKTIIVTNAEGEFSFDCGTTKSVTVSYIGYEPVVAFIKNCDAPLEISLQPSTKYLNEVEVSAISSQNKSLLYQPVSIAKLNVTELKRGTGLFLDDAINANVPGVTMNRRTVSAGQQFNIRGYGNGTRGTRGPSSNFDGQGYKVYLNGIPITDAEGITVMDDIDFNSIGGIEVTKGPAGSLYGLAIAGAVNLRSIQPAAGVSSVSQEAIMGNYGLRRYTTQLEIGGEKTSILVNYGHQTYDGITFHNKSKKDFVNLIGDFRLSEKQVINTYAGFTKSYDERYGELTIQQWNNNDYSGNPEYIKRDAHSGVRTIRAGVSHSYNFTKNISNTTVMFGSGFISDVSSAGGWTDKNFVNYGLRSSFKTRFKLSKNISLSGITGVETQSQRGQTIGYSMKKSPFDTTTTSAWNSSMPYWVVNAATSNFYITTGTNTAFTEWTLSFPLSISLTAGVGVSTQKINLNDRFNTATATKPSIFDTTYTNMVSPHIALNKVFNKLFSVYLSYNTGYKAPTSSYFYITTPVVNTNPVTPATGRLNQALEPEVGRQLELGTKGQLINKRLDYEVALFNTIFDNKMTSVGVGSPLQPNTTLYSYIVNGGKQNHKGAEVAVHYTVFESVKGFLRSVRPFGNMAYSDYKYENFTYDSSVVKRVNFDGKAVAGVAKWVFNVGVDVEMAYGLYANINYNYRDKMPITADNLVYAPNYNLLNGKIGIKKDLSAHFSINAYAGAMNITGAKYYLMAFANQLPDAFLPAPKNANAFGGINVRYNF